MESILGSIHVYRVHDYVEQIAVVASLQKFLDEHPKVKLVCFCCALRFLFSPTALAPQSEERASAKHTAPRIRAHTSASKNCSTPCIHADVTHWSAVCRILQVVMDSVAFQFQCDFKDYAMRTRLLTASAQRLTQLALERNIAGATTPCPLARAISCGYSLPARVCGWCRARRNWG